MKVLILGGTHLVGPWLVEALCRLNHTVSIFNRGQTKSKLPTEVKRIYGDRRQLKNYKDILQKVSPDIVIDMIALTETDAEQLISIFGTSLSRLIVISSGDVYLAHQRLCQCDSASYETMPLQESSKLRDQAYPYRSYAKDNDDVFYFYDKCRVESVINAAQINTTILRFPFVYGHPDTSRLMPYLKIMRDMKSEIILDQNKAKWRSTRGYVENMATAILAAAFDTRKGKFIYNVGEERALTEKEWIQKIAKQINWRGSIVEKEKDELPASLQEPYDWKQSLIFDTSKIREELHYKESCSEEQSLGKTIEWALANMP